MSTSPAEQPTNVEQTKPASRVVEDEQDIDKSVYKRGQQAKWARSRKAERGDRNNKRQRRDGELPWEERKEQRVLDADGNPLPSEPRRPKKKVACLIGYCGTGYHGMQLNPPQKTIEGDLFEAFVASGAISRDNSNDLKKSSFMRAARTDKGVHAAGNVISLKMIIEDEDILEKINSKLPPTIRVWGYERTNKNFDCRKMCSSRIYEYLMPTFSFLPPKPNSPLARQIKEANEHTPGVTRNDPEGYKWWADVLEKLHASGITDKDIQDAQEATINKEKNNDSDDEPDMLLEEIVRKIKQTENQARREYRISKERLELVNKAMQIYIGHHNFHNFTLGKHFKDASANRYMKEITVSEPFVIEGTEWVSIKIHGQSFMLHQIRKMIAMAALVVRTGCPLERISEAFQSSRINIPKAPALGLLLEQPVYEGYNTRLKAFGYNELTFTPFEKEMNEFKMKHIYDKIYAEEVKDNTFHGFFGFIDGFNGTPIFNFLTANGIKESQEVREVVIPNEKNEGIAE
ncbi:BA75_00852T0 [Komagataella pastoris]|uniref:tRNA pseudouridine synthase 1 n=1 Tax=Komagataella pastoris TaxID=4922 RepID=A0A1B2J7N2_PICPA|nr:BA75_00852T0 [Komagataella pastoris]